MGNSFCQNNCVVSLYDQFRLLGGAVMAKCAICEKGAHFGNNVSHSHRKTPKMWKSNVKSVRVKTEGGSKRMYVCTSCLKSGRVERAQSDKDLRHGINPVPKTGIGFYFFIGNSDFWIRGKSPADRTSIKSTGEWA